MKYALKFEELYFISPFINNGTKIAHVFLSRMELSCILARSVT
jgi:hypothetical protein